MYFRKKTSGGRAYLQIVESRRDGAQVRQQVIATLGRIEDLRDSGQLERLLRSGARFAAKALTHPLIFFEIKESEAGGIRMKRIGAALLSLFSVDIAQSRIERPEATEEFPPIAR